MTLQDYTTEELKAELKRRAELAKAEKSKIKRCRMCKHWGEVTYFGKPTNGSVLGVNRCCKFFTNKAGKYYRFHSPSQPACENFESIINN